MVADGFIGKQLGDFIVRERIGQGGMATVFRAHQRSVNRDVALKIILLGDASRTSETFRRRFDQEAALIARLEHIHILPVYDYGITDDAAYLAMRLLRGGTLGDALQGGPLAIESAATLFGQFASGLAYAHRQGVIHRDLKPSNIMLDDSGNALLTDFGLAKLVGDSGELTLSGTVVGTPGYMSPEQLRGQPLDHRSDIYSAGAVFYHMLTGRTPFGGPASDLVATIYQQLESAPPSPREINPALSAEIESVILRALAKRPEDRYTQIEDMVVDLDRSLGRSPSGNETILARPATSGSGRHVASLPLRKPRRRLVPLVVGVGLALVLGTLAVRQGFGPRWNAGGGTRGSVPASKVRAGEYGQPADALPVAAEVTRARAHLGSNGFIAYVTCTQSTAYHATQAREMNDFATHFGLRLRVYDSDADDYRQITQIERARADGATGLILCPLNAGLLATHLASAQQDGVPIVLMSSGMPSYGGVLVAGDDYAMGLAAGRFAGDIVAKERGGKARAIVLDYPEVPSLVTRAKGLEQGLLERAPQARILGHFKGGTREYAAAAVGKALQHGGSFDLVLSINDAGAFGAIAAMQASGIAPDKVLVSSVDAEPLARDYIRKGYFIRGSVATDRTGFSQTAIHAMIKLLAGSALPETITVPPGEVVTRETLEKNPG